MAIGRENSSLNGGWNETQERAALIAFYNAANGDQWRSNDGWKDAPLDGDGFGAAGSESIWEGITVSDGHVTEIQLPNNHLAGTITPELANLDFLEELALGFNQLSGSIPPELGTLSNLTGLDLYSNQLTGEIPVELANLTNLYLMDLQSNRLTGNIPSQLGNLANLYLLYLQDNRLEGTIPPQLGNLGNLVYLNLASNQLMGGIPTTLSGISNLVEMTVDYNALYTHDATLRDFLDARSPGWANTQTVVPANPSAAAETFSTARVSWSPIIFSGEDGGYRVYYSTTSGGPWTSAGITTSKSASYHDVAGLVPGNTYYFVVNTVTEPHRDNFNRVESENSGETSVTLTITATVPTVSTTAVSAVTSSTAISGGNVTDAGGSTVTVRGVCWSIEPNPDTSDDTTSDGTGTGPFTSTLSGLNPGTTYYVRAYAVNDSGIAYGEELTFTTSDIPVISGTVSADGVPLEGVTIAFSHDGNVETTADDGTYAYAVAAGKSFTVSASKSGYAFNPPERTVKSIKADRDGQDFNARVLPFSIALTSPADRAQVADAVIVTAEVTGDILSSETTVDFYIDDEAVKRDTRAPYQYRWETRQTTNGNHTLRATALHASGATASDKITLRVVNSTAPPHLVLHPERLNFGAVSGGDQSRPQVFTVNNSGGGLLDWTASVSNDWIQATPTSGGDGGAVTLSVDVSGLSAGTHLGTVSITDPAADNSPQTVIVNLEIIDAAEDLPLIGGFDSPVEGAAVEGSVAVSGWALDDVRVEHVKIYRQPVAGEGAEPVYLGDAAFVEGARPDIAALYPDYPNHNAAGWGYMLLTNALPGGGNGPFTLTAVGTEGSGGEVILGTRTIVSDNAGSANPFGAIDAPAPGGAVSGAEFMNAGWALTPLPNTIPIDGSTIRLWVDGVQVPGYPAYNIYREDVATFFPGYTNSNGALAYFYLDATLYADGLHTMAWTVTDDAGNTAGIGSRFFTVANGESRTAAPGFAGLARLSPAAMQKRGNWMAPLSVRSGYADGVSCPLYPGADGGLTARLRPNQPVVIRLREQDDGASRANSGNGCYYGYRLNGKKPAPLPAGSFLDTAKGIFYWQPGPGFMGTFNLFFIAKQADGSLQKIAVTLLVSPRGE